MVSKQVFSHYFTPYIISWDDKIGYASQTAHWTDGDFYNVHYLNPDGEGGSHAAYGGLLRDRPPVRSPIGTGYAMTDMHTEVQRAMTAGLTGFTLDLFVGTSLTSPTYNMTRQKQLLQAAIDVGGGTFKILLMPDTSAWKKRTDYDLLSSWVQQLAAYSSVFKTDDGRLVISPFYAEAWTTTQWNTFIGQVQSKTGLTVAFVPCFLTYSTNVATFKSNIPQMYGASIWGGGNPAALPGAVTDAADAHSRDLIWMHPTRPQDERPDQSLYDEALGTKTARQSFDDAISAKAEWVQMITWNDYSEGAQWSPSMMHGEAWLALASWYIRKFKTDATPVVTNDAVVLVHRQQPYSAAPTGWTNPSTGAHENETSLMKLRGGSTAAADIVEACVWLTSPATITVNGGTPVNGVTGLNVVSGPFTVGTTPNVVIVRNGVTVLTVTSNWKIQSALFNQDLQYTATTNVAADYTAWHADAGGVISGPRLTFDFEAGTAGATVAATDPASPSKIDAVITGAGAVLAYDTTHAAHGSKALKVSTGTTLTASSVKFKTSLVGTGMAGPVYGRIYLYLTSLSTQPVPISFMNGNFANLVGVRVKTSGQLAVLVNGTGSENKITTNVVPLNQWIRIELKAIADATNGAYEMRYYSSMDSTSPTETLVSDPGLATAASGTLIDTLSFGCTQQLTNCPALWVDDIGGSTSNWLGPYGSGPPTNASLLTAGFILA